MSESERVALWPHQRDAVDAATKTLAEHPRTTLVAACGSGKTLIGGQIARARLPEDGALLLVAPTLDLIAQTLREYRERFGARAAGALVAVCSDRGAVTRARIDLAEEHLDAEVTTSPALLEALLRRGGRRTVACTYQSLHVLEALHRRWDGRWDLAVIDEAHRTAGVRGRPWSAINDDARIPCERRLYMTATPRVFEHDDVVSMDDEALYGPRCYHFGFGDAIAAGVLADYELVVPVITDRDVLALTARRDAPYLSAAGGAGVSPRMLAVQVAVLRAAAQLDIGRLVTFHRTIADARGFALTLPAATTLLEHGEGPAHLRALHVSGQHTLAHRRAVLGHLDSEHPGLVVVSNARVLAEGVNVPGIDAVAFIDPRGSAEATIQAVGRALRTGGRVGKKARIIVPVLLNTGQSPDAALDGSPFTTVWNTVRALCAHDERLAANLALLRYRVGHSVYQPAAESLELPGWLTVTGIPVPEGFARAIALSVIKAGSESWEEMVGRADAFHATHRHLTPSPAQDARLHLWLTNQRALHASGRLSAERTARLEQLGIAWSVHGDRLEQGVEALRAFRREHGHLKVPKDALYGTPPMSLHTLLHRLRGQYRRGELPRALRVALDGLDLLEGTNDAAWAAGLAALRAFHAAHGHTEVPVDLLWGEANYPLGRWWAKQRAAQADATLRPERARELEELSGPRDMQQGKWERGLAAAAAFHAAHGHLLVEAGTRVTVGSVEVNLGSWIRNQRAERARDRLRPERAARLDALGMVWDVAEHRWWLGLAAAEDHLRTRGNLQVAYGQHWGGASVRLDTWLARTLAALADGTLPRDQREAAERLGLPAQARATPPPAAP